MALNIYVRLGRYHLKRHPIGPARKRSKRPDQASDDNRERDHGPPQPEAFESVFHRFAIGLFLAVSFGLRATAFRPIAFRPIAFRLSWWTDGVAGGIDGVAGTIVLPVGGSPIGIGSVEIGSVGGGSVEIGSVGGGSVEIGSSGFAASSPRCGRFVDRLVRRRG